jgi:enoyl-CoA hydratase/carnithine racemase
VLIVIGEGRAFSSGIDTSVFVAGIDDEKIGLASLPGLGTRDADPTVDIIMGVQESYTWLAEAPFCTIAAIRGYAYGAGLQMAAACDLRVIARGAKVGLLELKYGILPDLGGTQRVPRLVGPGKAKELIFTGARIDAEEAYRIGLCERLVDDDALEAEVTALADLIAAQPPLAVRGAKAAVDRSFELDGRDGLRFEAQQQRVCIRSDDMREAISAFIENRTPTYHAT